MKIFIGTEDRQVLSTAVLKHSILSRTKEHVEFVELKKLPLKVKVVMYTGFSFYRFSIPMHCNFEGEAAYVDTDIVCLCPIEELFAQRKNHKVVARSKGGVSRYTSVMVMDCSQLKHWDFETWIHRAATDRRFYTEIMWGVNGSPNAADFGDLPPEYNHLDMCDATTKLLHYTNVPTQPWTKSGHKFGQIFLRELKTALQSGYITRDLVQEQINKHHTYRNILREVERS